MYRLIFSATFIVLTFGQAFEKKCKDGEKLSKLTSTYDEDKPERTYEAECAPLFKSENVKPNCRYADPQACDSELEGCDEGEWLAGVRGNDVGVAVPLLEAYCCKAGNVKLECDGKQQLLNFKGDKIDQQLKNNQVIGGQQECQLLVARPEDGVGDEEIVDVQHKVQVCKYTVDGETPPESGGPSQDGTTQAPASGECSCDFESGLCGYQQSQGQWTTSNKRLGNRDTGVPPPPGGGSFIGTESEPGQKAVLEYPGKVGNKLDFMYYEATENLSLQACIDDESNCLFQSNNGINKEDRGWKKASIPVPNGAQKVLFVVNNEGINYGAIGIDDITCA